jgi:hypothetical protein
VKYEAAVRDYIVNCRLTVEVVLLSLDDYQSELLAHSVMETMYPKSGYRLIKHIALGNEHTFTFVVGGFVMKAIDDNIDNKSLIHKLTVADVDEDVVEDMCFDRLVVLYPSATITCLDIDSDDKIYYLTFLVEER